MTVMRDRLIDGALVIALGVVTVSMFIVSYIGGRLCR